MKIYPVGLTFLIAVLLACNFKQEDKSAPAKQIAIADSGRWGRLVFSFQVERDEYELTNYGEPPQIAIWLESTESKQVRTVWVSNRAAKNNWKGKVECPVALPYWESRVRLAERERTSSNKRMALADGQTAATPTGGAFVQKAVVEKDSKWVYFIEVNVSGDYNAAFPYWSEDGRPDPEGNGQPSVIYRGEISADGRSKSVPCLIGRTFQRYAADSINTDLSGITSARRLLSGIKVIAK